MFSQHLSVSSKMLTLSCCKQPQDASPADIHLTEEKMKHEDVLFLSFVELETTGHP